MTYHYQAHTYIAQWREQAKSDPVERAYIEKMGILPFVNINWADVNLAPRMRLIEEFINGAVHHLDRMEAEVDGKTCVINFEWTSMALYKLLQPAHSSRLSHQNRPIAYHSVVDPHPYIDEVAPVFSTYPPPA